MIKKLLLLLVLVLGTRCAKAQVLIIPDVHGRTFWKEAVSKYPHLPVIFLGDYLDPYSLEGITPDEALPNFREILDYKKANMGRVTLLMGNHELHYIDQALHFSRKDTINQKVIQELLYENLSLFKIATHVTCNGKQFLFSHAGILEPWWEKHFPTIDTKTEAMCDALNEKLKDVETLRTFIGEALMDASKIRGGKDEAGSCVWADDKEHKTKKPFPDNVYQIFGHTQLRKSAKIKKNVADLDCRKAFILTADGKIKGII